jgi:outer membrane protein TolC
VPANPITSKKNYSSNAASRHAEECLPPARLSPISNSHSDKVKNVPADYSAWWGVFKDPVLNDLVKTAYVQNVNLRIAGTRVLEARAQQAIAVGALFPQEQQASGS